MKTVKTGVAAPGFSFIGIAFCLLSAFKMADVFCITEGCSVYEGFSVFGISLYWFGAAAFLALFCLSFAFKGRYLLAAAAFFLSFDLVFLLIQVLLWPCAQCLMVAALFGAVMLAAMTGRKLQGMRGLFAIWLLLFSVNLIAAGRESLGPWPVYGNNEAPVRLYFSPTCPSCRTMIDALLSKNEALSRVALYPVSKNPEDTRRIMLLNRLLESGISIKDALVRYQQDKETDLKGSGPSLQVRWRIFRNLMALSRLGVTRVPYLTAGTPFWAEAPKAASLKDDCPVFSRNPSGLCEDAKAGGLKDLFKSK